MLREFVEKIIELKKPELISDSLEREYISGNYKMLKNNVFPTLESTTLRSIVDFIKENKENYKSFIIHVINQREVKLISKEFGITRQRDVYIHAIANIPKIDFNYYNDQENFIISLLSNFEDGNGREYVLNIASNIVDGKEIAISDNGISQKINIKQGLNLKEENINPFVLLKPNRTFLEVNQPESIFLLRMKTGGSIAIFDTDGGSWINQATENIANYFKEQLKDVDVEYNTLY
jgi:hypothetical protein